MADSTRSGGGGKKSKPPKPKKPHPDFPLYAHASGRWAKRINGKIHYFGSWADGLQAALEKWLDQKDALLAGRKPREKTEGAMSVRDACDHYLSHIDEKVGRGLRSDRWLEDLKATIVTFRDTVGPDWDVESLTEEDFAEAERRLWTAQKQKRAGRRKSKTKVARVSPITARNRIHRVRGMFKWLVATNKIDRPPKYGASFNAPDKTSIDRHRDNNDKRYFTRSDVRRLLRYSKDEFPQLHTAILLGINTGCQNQDITTLRFKHLDLVRGWYFQPRSKKAKQRRAKLWKRTVRSLKELNRYRETGPDDYVFVSKSGGQWHGRNCLAKEFAELKEIADIDYPKCGFQWLRHSFITEANQTGDLIAVQLACGHAPRTVTENYIHSVYDPRLEAIAATVEHWLVGNQKSR